MERENPLDFKDVYGQDFVKRAALIAAAGRHNLLMIGPPGSGKTMIAKRIPGILPEMTFEEQMEISKIYSVAGLLSKEKPYIRERPFRDPHHTTTKQALAGGGRVPKPGEISLASGGVLFLDELAEFKRETIEVLRQPLEEGYVNIARAEGNYRYPAKCQLIAATNPCKCGFYPDRRKCVCRDWQIRSYLDRISGPMLERIDLCVEMQPLDYQDFLGTRGSRKSEKTETTAEIRKKVMQAYLVQTERYAKESFLNNASIPSNLLERYCPLTKEAEEYISEIFASLELSARVYHKILKVARTIADLSGSLQIERPHIAEAVLYRMVDKKYWGGGIHG
ncbi:MAG: YifB family Mg chelatase-like AAA ATPase [Lachnospiraceae bacterium]|nr:YifB family Mg chelatase-like AAA ATPase [Lachnospiraceae bacterium]